VNRSVFLSLFAILALPKAAMAMDPPSVHATANAGHAFVAPQNRELGWGGGGGLAVELKLVKYLGVQLAGDVLALSGGERPKDPGLTPRTAGTVFSGMGGLRGHIPGKMVGLWADVGGGVAASGSEVRPTLGAHVGVDIRFGKTSPWVAGPFAGYVLVVQPKDSVRPEDAHIATFGLHVAFDPPPKPKFASPSNEMARDPAPKWEDAPLAPPRNQASATDIELDGDLVVLPERIHFDFDKADVRSDSLQLVSDIAEFLNGRPDIDELEIEGHTDRLGSAQYNEALSKARAESVRKLLVDFGAHCHIKVRAYGFDRPRAEGTTDDDRKENRRVELRVHVKKGEPHASR
jgi:outer membrane protein OmpA-like peptidoglycan-associated protein